MTAFGEPYFLAWTTTPWTLPSNTALCVGPNIDYNLVQSYNPYTGVPISVIVAKVLVRTLFNPKAEGLSLEETLRRASAISAAAAMREETGFFVMEDMEKLLPQIVIQKLYNTI